MARLPQPGSDSGTWGSILNDYLLVSHKDNGTLKDNSVDAAALQNNAVTTAKLANGAISGSKLQDGSINGSKIQAGTIAEDRLTSDVQTKLNSGGTAGDASATSKGLIQLAGDLAGTAASPSIATGAISSTKLADGAVTTAKVNDGAITNVKIASGIAQSKITNLTSDLAAKQPLDSDLTTIAALSPADNDVLQRKSGAWTNRTPAQIKTDLAITKADVGLANVDNVAAATLLNRANHTGTQLAATISDFNTAVGNSIGTAINDATANMPLYIKHNGSAYPLRNTVTTDINRVVIWIGPTEPTVGSGFAEAGDIFWQTP